MQKILSFKLDKAPDRDHALTFYDQHYDEIASEILQPGKKKILGVKRNQRCRFCGRRFPEVSFKNKAHAIPEALGNKSLFTNYECDECNQSFGKGIENDLGNWSKPYRTFARICGSKGVPKLKESASDTGWRIEFRQNKFQIKQYEDNPFCKVDPHRKRVTLKLKRDVYTPVAVLKAFVKIGLTLLPEEEVSNFREALEWIREPNHEKVLVRKFPIFRTFRPGPLPNDLLSVILGRRKNSDTNVMYAFLVLLYGNEMFQIFLPCPEKDQILEDNNLTTPVFPPPCGPDEERYGKPRVEIVNLCGQEKRNDRVKVVLGFDTLVDSNL